ncbi:DUF21 domain-containing protein [Seminavis robusta]|uniref:DUF21 domain-containing protein n=1 Tax=Seminavis robusta TaxID=568900 RepID=A0A9N8HKS7_9STRA|nr:DUF21 domain-containing protein [Seminavis robusta]|eukprot:Sro633_g178860.1 DUF21 domain-containing protein (547) ;mRNA; r:37908-39548
MTEAPNIISVQAVQEAVSLLNSIGVKDLCHQTDPSWGLPLCDEDQEQFFLRGSSSTTTRARHLLELPEFETVQEAEEYYFINVAGAIGCVAGVALIAGLFLGLLTIDVLQLRIIIRASNDEDEKLYASTILPLVENRHLLLVTLLLMNALFYETLPLFLDKLVPSWMAILLSTTLIMFFGEILPSGVFTGPHQLYLGYRLASLTRCFMFLMYPFAKPLAMVLDYLVHGHEEEGAADDAAYNRGELSALVRIQFEDSRDTNTTQRSPTTTKGASIHKRPKTRQFFWNNTKQEIMEKANEILDNTDDPEEPDPAGQLAPPLHQTEVDLIEGALQMKTVLVMDVYTPLSHVYAIADDLVLDRKGFTGIYRQGYSRVPVYRKQADDDTDKTRILGVLMVRQLMLIDWDHKREVSTLPLQCPKCISPRTNLVDGLRILRSHGNLMAFVCVRPDLGNKALQAERPLPIEAGFMGIVTLEDIMESLLQERIYDEWDIRDRDRAVFTLQKWAATTLQKFAKKVRDKKRQRASLTQSSETAPLLVEGSKSKYSSV